MNTEINKSTEPSYTVGNVVIPGDIKLFNKMWQNKEFDNIDPAHLILGQSPQMYRSDNRFHTWADTFFKRRSDLTCMTALEVWEGSIYYSYMMIKVNQILETNNPFAVDLLRPGGFSKEEILEYVSSPPEMVMFPDKTTKVINVNDQLLTIYRDLIARFQLVVNKAMDERTSIYQQEIFDLTDKIQFIQMLCYYGVESVIIKFKTWKNNYVKNDPQIREIVTEPNEFYNIRFKEALLKFYTFCLSAEQLSQQIIDKARYLGSIVVQYADIRLLVTNYISPMRSVIKQDKLHAVCCQSILSYLRPGCLSDHYIQL